MPDQVEENDKRGGLAGCAIVLALAAFFVWVFAFREPDPEWIDQLEASETREETRLKNLKTACDSGVASACAEYREAID